MAVVVVMVEVMVVVTSLLFTLAVAVVTTGVDEINRVSRMQAEINITLPPTQ